MFEKLDKLFNARLDGMTDYMKNGIIEHLLALESKFERYFPETTNKDLDFVRNPFRYFVKSLKMNARTTFLGSIMIPLHGKNEKILPQFWIATKEIYPKTTKKSFLNFYTFWVDLSVQVRTFSGCKLKSNKEIDLTLKKTCDMHSLRLYLAFGCFQRRSKDKYHFNLKV